MRQVREVLRLKFVGGVPTREIGRRIGVLPLDGSHDDQTLCPCRKLKPEHTDGAARPGLARVARVLFS